MESYDRNFLREVLVDELTYHYPLNRGSPAREQSEWYQFVDASGCLPDKPIPLDLDNWLAAVLPGLCQKAGVTQEPLGIYFQPK